jgi:hypothetical protein
MSSPLWWHWIVLGLLLGIAEMQLPAFILIWFGAGAVLVGLVLVALPLGIAAQLALWTALSLLFCVLWFKVFRPAPAPRVGQSDAAVGEIGMIALPVGASGRGTVRFQKPVVGNEEWACTADVELRPGERVRVIAVEGNVLLVARVS